MRCFDQLHPHWLGATHDSVNHRETGAGARTHAPERETRRGRRVFAPRSEFATESERGPKLLGGGGPPEDAVSSHVRNMAIYMSESSLMRLCPSHGFLVETVTVSGLCLLIAGEQNRHRGVKASPRGPAVMLGGLVSAQSAVARP